MVEHPPVPQGRTVQMAAVFYGAFVLIALVWAGLAGRASVFWVLEPPSVEAVAAQLSFGALFGLICVGLTQVAIRRLAWMRELSGFFGQVLGPLTWTDAFGLALMSSIGEELLFRGAMQPTIGLIPASIVFMLMHWPPNKRMIGWTISAGVLGLAFGLSMQYSNHVSAAIAAHFTINFFNLKSVSEPLDKDVNSD